MQKLQVFPLAVAVGITWALGILLLGWAGSFGWGTDLVRVMSSLYIGYGPGFFGGIIGGIWALVDGAIFGAVITLVYNVAAGRAKSA
jgi:hypothetical protein